MGNVYDDIINGSFSQLQPSVAEMYAGIYPPASTTPQPTYQAGMLGRGQPASAGSPNLTAAEQQLLQQQIQQSQALQAGYNSNGTPRPVTPSTGIPATPAAPTWGPFEQANYDARNDPGGWMAQSRRQAEAMFRQMALRQGGNPALAAAHHPGGIASLITGHGTPRAGGLADLLAPTAFQTSNTGRTVQVGQNYKGTNGYTYQAMPGGTFANQGYSAQQQAARDAQGQAIGDANRANPNPTYSASGENNAFMPTSYQNSVRQQTGY